MRKILPFLMLGGSFLAACGVYPTPAPAASLAGAPEIQVTAAPDVFATRAAINAAAEYAIAQTATAQAAVQATQAAEQTAVSVAETARWSGVAAQQTQTALTATLQYVAAQQATGTQQAGVATATASAAAPVATATYEAERARDAEQSRAGLVWLLVGVGALVFLVVMLGLGGNRWIVSRGVEREKKAEGDLLKAQAEAEKIRSQAVPQVLGKQPPALGQPGWIVIFVQGQPKTFELPALGPIIDAAAPRPPAPLAEVSKPANLTAAQEDMIAFINDAVKYSKYGLKSNYIPTDSDMGYGGSDWTAHVKTLKALGVVETSVGRPSVNQKYGTRLVPRVALDLGQLLERLESGQIVVPEPAGATV
jgi:hypothetical protein